MSYRFMRILLFFDLPIETTDEKRHYRAFRKLLIRNGFVMMQESVYCRMVLNASIEKSVTDIIRKNRPPSGIMQLLTVTEKQFSRMEFITGESNSDLIDSDERVVIL